MSSAKRRPSPSTVLRKKRGRVVAKIHSITQQFKHATANGTPAKVDVHAVGQLRAVVASLHQQVAGSPDLNAQAVANALAHADTSLAKLTQANAATDGQEAMRLLAGGLDALTMAHSEAKRAGSDWAI